MASSDFSDLQALSDTRVAAIASSVVAKLAFETNIHASVAFDVARLVARMCGFVSAVFAPFFADAPLLDWGNAGRSPRPSRNRESNRGVDSTRRDSKGSVLFARMRRSAPNWLEFAHCSAELASPNTGACELVRGDPHEMRAPRSLDRMLYFARAALFAECSERASQMHVLDAE